LATETFFIRRCELEHVMNAGLIELPLTNKNPALYWRISLLFFTTI